jgi:hypothetical protein
MHVSVYVSVRVCVCALACVCVCVCGRGGGQINPPEKGISCGCVWVWVWGTTEKEQTAPDGGDKPSAFLSARVVFHLHRSSCGRIWRAESA